MDIWAGMVAREIVENKKGYDMWCALACVFHVKQVNKPVKVQ
jgi:hypothetical protein